MPRSVLSGPLVSGRGSTRAEDAQGTPTQSHISPSILVYEDYFMPSSPRDPNLCVCLAGLRINRLSFKVQSNTEGEGIRPSNPPVSRTEAGGTLGRVASSGAFMATGEVPPVSSLERKNSDYSLPVRAPYTIIPHKALRRCISKINVPRFL